MKENILDVVRKFVREECEKPEAKYGLDAFENHFVYVVKYCLLLAEKLDADKEVVEISAWLHDIGSIIFGRENHHITGSEIAEKKLKELNYPDEKIEKIKKCILNHRGSQNSKRESVEEKILAEADALSCFDNLSGHFKAAFVFENLNQEQAKKSILKKWENKFNQFSEDSKKLIQPKYEALIFLLGGENAD